jgi:hypothetical protein
MSTPEANVAQLSFVLAGRVEPSHDKLQLLNDVSGGEEDLVCHLLEDAISTARRVRGAAERAATNGRVQLG